ncbi:MAG: glycoside hydrolase family 36 protein [Turicibacter sp.]
MRLGDFIVKNSQENVSCNLELSQFNQVDYVEVNIECEEETIINTIEIEFYVAINDFQYLWTPNNGTGKNFTVDWYGDSCVKQTISAPVLVFFDHVEQSRFSFAFSDAIEPVYLNFGVEEETGRIKCRVVLFKENTKKIKSYTGTFRINLNPSKFNEEINNISCWYEKMSDYIPMEVPEPAYDPVYSTWYSFHQRLSQDEIEAQCRIGADLGLKTIIVDDGWQTEDTNRGYAYTGDWELSEKKFPSFKEHIKRVQEMGVKYVVWYSIPFMGINSKMWDKFSDKIISYDETLKVAVLDVRYKEVRDYIVNVYRKALIEWNIDGFKLDFIDMFNMHNATEKALTLDSNRETESLADAVNDLLDEIKEALITIKPDILIEFRQRYIGPSMRSYGNIFRVSDCPYNVLRNRTGVVDLRLLSGKTAVHSDMIMWGKEEIPESAALQLINVLFSVPQYSLDLSDISVEHFKMSKFYLELWNKHKNVFIMGKINPLAPHLSYPVIYGEYENQLAVTVHGDYIVKLDNHTFNYMVMVNGAMLERIIVDLEVEFNGEITIYNCLGEVVESKLCKLPKGLQKLTIPKSGTVILNSNNS